MVLVLAGYIAFSIADRPGLTPGLIMVCWRSAPVLAFDWRIIAGFLAGYIAKISTKLKLPQSMELLGNQSRIPRLIVNDLSDR